MAWTNKGRSVFQAKYRDEHGKQHNYSCQTPIKATAERVEKAVNSLVERGEWKVLEAFKEKRISPMRVLRSYDEGTMHELRVEVSAPAAINLEPLIAQFAASHGRNVEVQTMESYVTSIRKLIPKDKPFLSSDFTREKVQEWLDELTLSNGAIRRNVASLSCFASWLVARPATSGLAVNPCFGLKIPPPATPRDQHLSMDEVTELLWKIPSRYAVARDVVAVCYGTGGEVNAVVNLLVEDVRPVEEGGGLVFIRGSKGRKGRVKSREREAPVATWCWPTLVRLCADKGPKERLFPKTSRQWWPSECHRTAMRELGREKWSLHSTSRSTYAVRMIQAGASSAAVGQYLGHHNGEMVERVYGKYRTKVHEMMRLERQASKLYDRPPERHLKLG